MRSFAPQNPASKLLQFDAHLYLSSSKGLNATHALALLRYFNYSDIIFRPDEVYICFVVANVSTDFAHALFIVIWNDLDCKDSRKHKRVGGKSRLRP